MFIEGRSGRLFAVFYPPCALDPNIPRRALLYLPPFAEEMNRARRMAALMARRLASGATAVLLLDPYGTGDSAGDFADARWEIWRDDATTALAWLRDRGYRRRALLGLRLGACLALDVAGRVRPEIERLVLWQPVVTGSVHLNQFLRIRVAAELGAGDPSRETVTTLRGRLAAGEIVEVAGYPLAPQLAAAIDRLRLEELDMDAATPIDWLQVTGDPTTSLAPAAEAAATRWRDTGVQVAVKMLAGESFWAIEETTIVPALLDATCELFEGART